MHTKKRYSYCYIVSHAKVVYYVRTQKTSGWFPGNNCDLQKKMAGQAGAWPDAA